jgi:hypothetical protein
LLCSASRRTGIPLYLPLLTTTSLFGDHRAAFSRLVRELALVLMQEGVLQNQDKEINRSSSTRERTTALPAFYWVR